MRVGVLTPNLGSEDVFIRELPAASFEVLQEGSDARVPGCRHHQQAPSKGPKV